MGNIHMVSNLCLYLFVREQLQEPIWMYLIQHKMILLDWEQLRPVFLETSSLSYQRPLTFL